MLIEYLITQNAHHQYHIQLTASIHTGVFPETFDNTLGTAGGPGGRDRTLAVNSQKST